MAARVLVVCATELELIPFLDSHPIRLIREFSCGAALFSGILGSVPFDLVITGPGVFNCVHGLTLGLSILRPDIIIHTGIAGVFKGSGLSTGDVAVAVQEQYIHTGVTTQGPVKEPLPFDLIENCGSTRQGIYPVDPRLVRSCCDLLSAAGPDFQVAGKNFITVSAITGSNREADRLEQQFHPAMESMEGAGAAHVAALHHIPMVEVRAGSNRVGERNKSKWDIPLAAHRVAWILDQVIPMKIIAR